MSIGDLAGRMDVIYLAEHKLSEKEVEHGTSEGYVDVCYAGIFHRCFGIFLPFHVICVGWDCAACTGPSFQNVETRTRMALSKILFVLVALFGPILSVACTPPAPEKGLNSNPIVPPPPIYRFSFVGEVIGEEVVTAMGRSAHNAGKPMEILALRILVIASSNQEILPGAVHVVYRTTIGSSCEESPGPLTLRDFSLGAKVRIKSNDLKAALVYYSD